MANIQASINQAISLATLLATQSPKIKAIGEKNIALQNIRKENEVLEKQFSPAYDATQKAIKGLQDIDPSETEKVIQYAETEIDPAMEEVSDIVAKQTSLAKRAFETDPNKRTYERYLAGKKASKEQAEFKQTTQDLFAEMRQADLEVAKEQELRRETRRRILEGTPSEHILRGE